MLGWALSKQEPPHLHSHGLQVDPGAFCLPPAPALNMSQIAKLLKSSAFWSRGLSKWNYENLSFIAWIFSASWLWQKSSLIWRREKYCFTLFDVKSTLQNSVSNTMNIRLCTIKIHSKKRQEHLSSWQASMSGSIIRSPPLREHPLKLLTCATKQ